MVTRIYEGKKENGSTYYQGQLLIIQGRLKQMWIDVTIPYLEKINAITDLEAFKDSVK